MRKKLIELLDDIQRFGAGYTDFELYGMRVPDEVFNNEVADNLIANGVTVLPCKIGDTAFAIRNYKGHIHPHRGIVREMYFVKGMKLHIVVQNVARGEWGKTVFGTYEEACAAIERRKK